MTLQQNTGGTGDRWPTHKAKARQRRASRRAGYPPRVTRLHVGSIEGLRAADRRSLEDRKRR